MSIFSQIPQFSYKDLPSWVIPLLITIAIGLLTTAIVIGVGSLGQKTPQNTKLANQQIIPAKIEADKDLQAILEKNKNQSIEETRSRKSLVPEIVIDPKNNLENAKQSSQNIVDVTKTKASVCDLIITYNKPTGSTDYQNIIECQPKDSAFMTSIESLMRVKSTSLTSVDKNNYSIFDQELKSKITKLVKSTYKDGKSDGVKSYERVGFEYNNNLYAISLEPQLIKSSSPIISTK